MWCKTDLINYMKMGACIATQLPIIHFSSLQYKGLKQVHPDTGVYSKPNKIITMTSRMIQTAVGLLLPGELALLRFVRGAKSVTRYTSGTKLFSGCFYR